MNNKCQTNIDPLIKLKKRALIIVHLGHYHGSTHEFLGGIQLLKDSRQCIFEKIENTF